MIFVFENFIIISFRSYKKSMQGLKFDVDQEVEFNDRELNVKGIAHAIPFTFKFSILLKDHSITPTIIPDNILTKVAPYKSFKPN